MTWLHDALNSVVLTGRRPGRSSGDALGDAHLPAWLERRLGWNRAADERRARDAERSHERPPRGKDADGDW